MREQAGDHTQVSCLRKRRWEGKEGIQYVFWHPFLPICWAFREGEFWLIVPEFCTYPAPSMPEGSERIINPSQLLPDLRGGAREREQCPLRTSFEGSQPLYHSLLSTLTISGVSIGLLPSISTQNAHTAQPCWVISKAKQGELSYCC